MKIAIISDIHGNLEALEAVAGELERLGVRELVCLGDIVGYGTNPRECIDFVAERALATVAGNHDLAAVLEGASDFFNPAAREAAAWTARELRASDRAFLASLPVQARLDDLTMELVHGECVMPRMFEYIQDCVDGYRALQVVQPGNICFVGHTHVAVCFREPGPFYDDGSQCHFEPEGRAVVNVGSVGQPRDGDRRACFAVFDSAERTLEIRRVAYDYETAARKIREAGLTQVLGDRLRFGR